MTQQELTELRGFLATIGQGIIRDEFMPTMGEKALVDRTKLTLAQMALVRAVQLVDTVEARGVAS